MTTAATSEHDREKFDIITSDPIDPWVKGCAALNTVEYFQLCRDHLNIGGSVSLWVPLYESDLEDHKADCQFFQVFPMASSGATRSDGRGMMRFYSDRSSRSWSTSTNFNSVWTSRPRTSERVVSGSGFRRRPDWAVDEGLDLLATYAGQARRFRSGVGMPRLIPTATCGFNTWPECH